MARGKGDKEAKALGRRGSRGSSSSDEELEPPMEKRKKGVKESRPPASLKQKTALKAKTMSKKNEESEEESQEEFRDSEPKPTKKREVSKANPSEDSSSSGYDSEPESEGSEDRPAPKPTARQLASLAKANRMDEEQRAESEEMREKEAPSEPEIKSYKVTDGKAPVDEYVPNRDNFEVYEGLGKVYSKVLTCSNLGKNNNKFYNIQLLVNTKLRTYYTFYRWGRIGKKGQCKLNSFYANIAEAILDFDTKYAEKAEDGGIYDEISVVFTDELTAEAQDVQMEASLKTTKISPEVADLIKGLFSLKMFNQQIKEIGYDIKQLPLGKLSQNNIKIGFDTLRRISKEIEGKATNKNWKKTVEELSSTFFTNIPTDAGHKHMYSLLLDTREKVDEKLEFLDVISKIKIAKSMIDDQSSSIANVIDRHYANLHTDIQFIPPKSERFELLQRFFTSTHAASHQGFKMVILEAFSIDKAEEANRFNKNLGNNLLLWHGSRMTNFAGIISQGLNVPPPEAPSLGFMFGKGIYFTDMSSKAGQLCYSHLSDGLGFILLCEVALGTPHKLNHADFNASNLPPGSHSTMGCGGYGPDPRKAEQSTDGYTIPMGPCMKTEVKGSSLQFNEYIVYNANQVRMRYLLKCKFN